ncbi:MAG: hypothetical protein ABW182_07630, partial [Sphingomonas sp.]
MKRKIFGCLVAAVLLVSNSAAPDYDIVIRGGRVLDGAGNPWVKADVALKDGRVVRIGTVPGRGKTEIDATGRYVSPGFIGAFHPLLRAADFFVTVELPKDWIPWLGRCRLVQT